MTDEQTAAAIVADSRNACDETAMEASIVRALQAARESALDTHANAAVLRMCHEARMMNGIVDYSDPKATGVVRKVLGVLPVTEDGCVAGHGAVVSFGDINYRMVMESQYETSTWNRNVCVAWGGPNHGAELLSDCHSVREAAEVAKDGKA